jgi:hypothetical protein
MADLGIFVQILEPSNGLRLQVEDPLLEPFPRRTRVGYRAWIRTMNNASKGHDFY